MSQDLWSDQLPEEILEAFARLSFNISQIENATSDSPQSKTFLASANKFQIANDLKFLRNVCSKGSRIQDFIISTSECMETILSFIRPQEENQFLPYFEEKDGAEVERILWQFIGNLCVQNANTQAIIYEQIGEIMVTSCMEKEIDEFTDIKLMILFNIFKGQSGKLDEDNAFAILVKIWTKIVKERSTCNLVFLHLFFEHFIVEYQWTMRIYAKMETETRIHVLQYLLTYVRSDSPNGKIKTIFLDFLSKEFKKKSDCILKTLSSYVDEIHPQEVLALLKVIAAASGSDLYPEVYGKDHALFLNVGSLLKTLTSIGKDKNAKNIFTPMQSLAEVAPNSKISSDFELEVSFELKTLLVRTLANLTYKNAKNQEYAREMGIIFGILDCTSADARNPLIKEWSIVAVRNLCDNCPENQEIISNLCKVGEAPNDVLKELNMELGSLRIQPNK